MQDFEDATFVGTSFRGATLRSCDVSGVTMRGVDVGGLDIDSHDLFFGSLIVNGVDVVPLMDAELNRQFPGRELQTAQTPADLRDGWVAVQAAWATTVTNTPPDLVDAHVEDEWSLAQSLRHLVLVQPGSTSPSTAKPGNPWWLTRPRHGCNPAKPFCGSCGPRGREAAPGAPVTGLLTIAPIPESALAGRAGCRVRLVRRVRSRGAPRGVAVAHRRPSRHDAHRRHGHPRLDHLSGRVRTCRR